MTWVLFCFLELKCRVFSLLSLIVIPYTNVLSQLFFIQNLYYLEIIKRQSYYMHSVRCKLLLLIKLTIS